MLSLSLSQICVLVKGEEDLAARAAPTSEAEAHNELLWLRWTCTAISSYSLHSRLFLLCPCAGLVVSEDVIV